MEKEIKPSCVYLFSLFVYVWECCTHTATKHHHHHHHVDDDDDDDFERPKNNETITDGGGGGDDDDEVPERQNGVLFGKKIHHHQQQHQEQQHLCVLEECWQRPKLRDDETKIILDFGVIIVVIVARGVFFLSSKNGSDDGRVRRGELRRFRSRARPGV